MRDETLRRNPMFAGGAYLARIGAWLLSIMGAALEVVSLRRRPLMKVTFSSVLKVELLVCNAEGRSRPRGTEPARSIGHLFGLCPNLRPNSKGALRIALRFLTKSLILLVGVQDDETRNAFSIRSLDPSPVQLWVNFGDFGRSLGAFAGGARTRRP